MTFGKLLELDDGVDVGTHSDIGDAFEDELDDDRNLVLLHQGPRPFEGIGTLVGTADADRFAAEALGDRYMIDAVTLFRIARGVDVVEGEADFEIHVEAALGLADKAEIGVVHDHMQIGQLVLRADRQFLDQELEVIVA